MRTRCLYRAVLAILLLAVFGLAGALERTPSPAGVELYFIGLKDHDVVAANLVVHFGLKGMGVAPAGVTAENTGHHHLLIDTPLPADLSLPLPAIEGKLLHFGKGQTEATVTLAPGRHSLQLVLGDSRHVPFDPLVASKVLMIEVRP
jgi:hypothetical protein